MRVQLMYNISDIRLRDWDFIPCIEDIIWDEDVAKTGKIYRVAERHVTLDSNGNVCKVTLNLDENLEDR
ncbi:hypothetical protein KAR91_42480 [Candidatus Pacearchaeota archaeon]|nr:hypothetical protein [Candidatus Pacearchaeota archaeon]